MGRTVGVREFKANPSNYLRLVKDENQEFDITVRGQAVARLAPLVRRMNAAELQAFWRRQDELSEQIGKHWPAEVSAVEAINEQRRDYC
jgi:antitoxin (DNA-binding transcriptional repressor) of toxin-antitoxin stability system